MLLRILHFELKYRLERPATYIYFFLMLLLGFMAMAVEDFFSAGSGQVKENAPTVLAIMSIALTALLGNFVVSAIMGVAVLRDYEHRTDAMIFTTPINKADYLFGRFGGSLLIAFGVFAGLPLGILLGSYMPWLDAERMLPVNAAYVFQPFFLYVLPMVFSMGCLFFAGGTLSRNILFVYLQGIALLALYLIADTLIRDVENLDFVAIIDPFMLNTQEAMTRYWTVSEQNTQMIPLAGVMLQNRLLWGVIGLLALAGTYMTFSFSQVKGSGKRRRQSPAAEASQAVAPLPVVHSHTGLVSQLHMLWSLAGLYYREIVRSLPFIAITLIGIIIAAVNAPYVNQLYGQQGYPTTYSVLELLNGFNLFFLIIILFYTGEIIWRERDLRMDQLYDTTPVRDLTTLGGKFLGFTAVNLTLITLLLVTGILIQVAYGYFKFELPVYIKTLYGSRFLMMMLFTVLGLFIQSLVHNKYAGHAVFALYFVFTLVMGNIGLEHGLWQFASGSLGTYSDMNTFGHFIPRFTWYKLYWFGLAAAFFAIAAVFSVRGTDTLLKTRLKLVSQRFSRPVLIVTLMSLSLFVSAGGYIWYNTTVINRYANSDAQEKEQAEYEKTLKPYEKVLKPRIVATNMKVDIYPESRDYTAEGYYILKNKSDSSITDLHIQLNSDRQVALDYLTVSMREGGEAQQPAVKEDYERFRYKIYQLPQALAPGDSMWLNFKVTFTTTGFEEGPTNTTVVENGTFFNNTVFPLLGYQRDGELADDTKRREQGLAPRERMAERTDSLALRNNLFGDNADHIRFEIVMSTTPDQIAIAPGYLQREWTENNRRYFHYKMDVPMANFYSMVSARYEVLRETWTSPAGQTIPLEIYYHPGHEYNLPRMMKGMRDALTYNSLHFSPFQYRQMRIMEFPRYQSFAQSFANTVPFSEAIGFMLKIDNTDPEAIDMAYYVTAHEIGHQWWGHQVMEAGVKGNAMLSETMSQYSALMVMKHAFPTEVIQKYLRYELDRYLFGRATESKKEQPLAFVESQGYIHYQKGSLVMYALQDYLGEDSINEALRRFVRDWAWREDRYPSSADLIGYFRQVTPDSMMYLYKDMFETITLFENRTREAQIKALPDGTYQVSLDLETVKYRADSLGNESPIPIADWIDIGVYGKSAQGQDSLLYLKKHPITTEKPHIEVVVPAKPSKAGIDPIHKLIDRNPEDNVKAVTEGV